MSHPVIIYIIYRIIVLQCVHDRWFDNFRESVSNIIQDVLWNSREKTMKVKVKCIQDHHFYTIILKFHA